MFACKWFEVFVLVSSVAKTAGQEVFSFDLHQDEEELILSTQTNLRRYLISSLTDVRKRIAQSEQFYPTVDGTIHDLQTRDLDPFMLFKYENNSEKKSFVAKTIQNLPGGNWNSLLQIIPVPDIQITPRQFQKIQKLPEPFVHFVLKGIQKSILKLNNRLLGDILYNFRFRDYSPELVVILENINQTIADNPEILSDFETNATTIDDILSDILTFISQKKPISELSVNHLLSSISGIKTLEKDSEELGELFDLILHHNYQPDVIQAKNKLAFAVRNNQMDTAGMKEIIKGYTPMEKLLILITKMSFRPKGNFSKEVNVLYPHVKLSYLSNAGKFFRPRTTEDVGFLLNSFLTIEDEMVLEEIQKLFGVLDWEEVLSNFDYSKYSTPRPLVVDMVQGLVNYSRKLPLCSIIILRYFLRKNRRVYTDGDFNDIQEMIVESGKQLVGSEYETSGVVIPPTPSETHLVISQTLSSPGTSEYSSASPVTTPSIASITISSPSEQFLLNSPLIDTEATLVSDQTLNSASSEDFAKITDTFQPINMTTPYIPSTQRESMSSESSTPISTTYYEPPIAENVLQLITTLPPPSRLVQSLSTDQTQTPSIVTVALSTEVDAAKETTPNSRMTASVVPTTSEPTTEDGATRNTDESIKGES